MIWEYQDIVDNNSLPLAKFGLSATYETQIKDWHEFILFGKYKIIKCKYCSTTLNILAQKEEKNHEILHSTITIQTCPCCGWWIITRLGENIGVPYGYCIFSRAQGSLKNLDSSNISTPIEELKQYILARYENRFKIKPKRLEDIVGKVFSDFGYQVRVTSFSGDKGIDVFVLDGERNDTIGIQVKRYKKRIEAEQIRSFGGALVLNGLTKGIFVTTSSYRKGAKNAINDFQKRGIFIDLWNSEDFFSKLKISQRSIYKNVDNESNPFFKFWKNPKSIPIIIDETW